MEFRDKSLEWTHPRPRPTTPLVAVNVANWNIISVFVKATGDLSQPGWSPVCNSIVFALFEKICLALKLS